MSTTAITHYVPIANGPTLDKSERIALCGVRTRVGGPSDWDPDAACGSSNRKHVTCTACLAKNTR